MPLNAEQSFAIAALVAFIENEGEGGAMVLSGYAGTGKTFTIKELRKHIRGRILYTAPTNKAVRVLRETLTEPDFRPECKTTFSALGLRMDSSGEAKVITKPENEDEEKIDLSEYRVIIVDEASMVSELLHDYLIASMKEHGFKIIFMGDRAQLPPVKEMQSPVWVYPAVTLTQVMRYDNAILKVATHIRDQLNLAVPKLRFETDWSQEEGGVRKLLRSDGVMVVQGLAAAEAFNKVNKAKVIAWRNVTVDAWNFLIRQTRFPGAVEKFVEGDRIILTSPAKDLEGKIAGRTDDEGVVEKVVTGWHPEHGEYKIFNLTTALDDGKIATFRVLHPDSQAMFERRKVELANIARSSPREWKKFWEFVESFHSVRYAYAITAHRAQGSTYETVFVDWKDILQNPNNRESIQCFYVACTRAKREVIFL